MRRPRHKLQVSTFPFLAVLLCAMGSLILFLLVMDRRAKLVANNKAREAQAAARATAEARAAEARSRRDAQEAALRQQQEQLHLALLSEHKEVQASTRAVHDQLAQAEHRTTLTQAELRALEEKLASERQRLDSAETALRVRAHDRERTEKEKTAAQKELERLSRDVLLLEKTLESLRQRSKQAQQTYSVVPYKGRHGSARPPLYIECTRAGVLLHPDRKPLHEADLSLARLRGEIERRAGELKVARPDNPKAPQESAGTRPYVLFLVRPDGVPSYYQALSNLKGFDLDFGFELVDGDWLLDFDASPAAAPRSTAVAPAPPAPARTGAPPAPTGEAHASGPPAPPGAVAALPGTARSTGPGWPGAPAGASGGGPIAGTAVGGPGGSAVGFPPPQAGSASGFPPLKGGIEGGISGQAHNSFPLPPGKGESKTTGNGASVHGGQPGTGGPPGTSAPGSKPGGGSPPPPGLTFSPSAPTSTPGAASPSSLPSTGMPPSGTPGQAAPSAAGQPAPAQTGEPRPVASAAPSRATPLSTDQVIASAGPKENAGAGGTAGSGSPGERDPLAHRLPPHLAADPRPKQPPALPLSRLIGNRDFIVTIDCYVDHVTIAPGNASFYWKSADTRDTDRRVQTYVAQLIERRQASVRPGEPPYRPAIRFQVVADGLRSYYHVYPLLEFLRVPMTRENQEE